jgi:hypothetical protein
LIARAKAICFPGRFPSGFSIALEGGMQTNLVFATGLGTRPFVTMSLAAILATFAVSAAASDPMFPAQF